MTVLTIFTNAKLTAKKKNYVYLHVIKISAFTYISFSLKRFNYKNSCGSIAYSISSAKRLQSHFVFIVKKILVSYRFITGSLSLVGRVFANCPGDLGSILGRVIPKTFKMVLDTSLLNTQQYKVRIKGKAERFRERSSALPFTTVL